MAATKSFEDGLIDKLEECFMRFQKCCTQVRQEFSLRSDKVFKSVEAAEKEKKSKLIQAAVKEKKNRERQAHSYGLQQNRCYKRRMDAKLFWKKFVVASQPTKKLRISLGKRFERLSFQEQPYSKRVPRGPCKTAYLHEEIVRNFHDYSFYLVFTKGILRRTWDPGIKIVQSNTLRTRQKFHFLSDGSDQNNKNTDCFKESVKEDSSKTEGNPTISEDDGTDSLREKGEDEWQPASENDLQNIQDTLDCCNLKPRMVVTRDDRARSKPSRCSYGPDLRCDHVLHLVVVQGLGSNYKSSGLEFHSTMILVLHLESNGLYGLLFGQRMTWDPGIRVIKILKQHLEDKDCYALTTSTSLLTNFSKTHDADI
ncbi:hypothetical protein Tco_1385531 [Tanacetum coccineum]